MIPIEFPEHNAVYAKDQDEFLPLPALVLKAEGMTISCWKLSWYERLKILITGTLWLSQLNFGLPLQAQRPDVDKPFYTTEALIHVK